MLAEVERREIHARGECRSIERRFDHVRGRFVLASLDAAAEEVRTERAGAASVDRVGAGDDVQPACDEERTA